ncbi:hypothetical protein [Haloarchaeobius sp. TZWWS8]|uniref:hypothetical protein n=1 Tax=Haloarchaeobius sp. TZWWS8 TaxID=3446121 RepID=UPI003EBA6B63
MVGPTTSEDDRRIGMSRLRWTFIGTVALSGALVALQAEASMLYIVAGLLGGGLAGAALWAYLVHMFKQGSSRGRDDGDGGSGEKRNRF